MARIIRTYVLSPEVVITLTDLVARLLKNTDLARRLGLLRSAPQSILSADVPVVLDDHGLVPANMIELAKLLGYTRPRSSSWDADIQAKQPLKLTELMEYAAQHEDPEKLNLARAYVKQSVRENRTAIRAREQALLRKAMNPQSTSVIDYSKSINNSRVLEMLITLGVERIDVMQREFEVAAKEPQSTVDRRTRSNAAKTQTQHVNSSPRSQATA